VAQTDFLDCVDHLVYATADLDQGVNEIERLLGVSASLGGRHPQWGTHNALAALGPSSYLEIIAPGSSSITESRPFGLDTPGPSRLVTWAAKRSSLARVRTAAAQQGVELGKVLSGSRTRPDGVVLSWELTDLRCVVADGIVPFLIDWENSPHPAATAAKGATLVSLRAEHPDADHVCRMLRALSVDLPVSLGHSPALIAEIHCPKGRVVLRQTNSGR
jgi:hypothetical protein